MINVYVVGNQTCHPYHPNCIATLNSDKIVMGYDDSVGENLNTYN